MRRGSRLGRDLNNDWQKRQNSLDTGNGGLVCLTICEEKEEMTWIHHTKL